MRNLLAGSITTILLFAASSAIAQPEGNDKPPPDPTPPPALPAPALATPPPPPVDVAPPEAPPPGAPSPFAVHAPEREQEPPATKALVGWNRYLFIRDANDWIHFYPGLRINFDADSFFGPGVSETLAADGGNGLATKLFFRRARFEFAGDFTRFFNFFMSVEFGGQPLTNSNGKTETAAGSAGQDPTSDTAKFATVQAPAASASLFDVWINGHFANEFNLMFGQALTTIGIENRTSDNFTPLMERNVAIRGFVVPNNREIGITAWGDIGKNTVLGYEGGIYTGDGQNRPQVDNHFDGIGRVFLRPLAASEGNLFQRVQVGMSGRFGQRDPKYVGYDVMPITTGQGYTLWNSTYKDSLGRTIHIIPSHDQGIVGGEFRLPIWRVALQSEAYYVSSDTREAVDGYQLTNSERFGALKGVGWYVQLSAWPWGDPFLQGDPGFTRPVKVDFDGPIERRKMGVEVLGVIAGVNANYKGASRQGDYDSKTPGAPDGPGSEITIRQIGAGVNVWYTRNCRLQFNYMAYQTPGSGSAQNLAVVPGNVLKTPDTTAHVLHELGVRLALAI